MKCTREKGATSSDTPFLIATVLLLILSWLSMGTMKKGGAYVSPFGFSISTSTQSYSPTTRYSGDISSPKTDTLRSKWAGLISIDVGNAPSEYQAYQEYIILRSSGANTKPINISGWKLVNAKGAKSFQVGGNVTRFAADVAIIPQAVPLYLPGKTSITAPVMLGQNGQAIIITGSNNVNGTSLPSIRENSCMPYLTNDKKNPFYLYPDIYAECPSPRKEIGYANLEKSCYDLISNLSSCRTPNEDRVEVDGTLESGYINGVGGLSDSCRQYIENHFSYPACVANHSGDENFFGDTWHVFLNKKWEMWAAERETITLLDTEGKVVASYSY